MPGTVVAGWTGAAHASMLLQQHSTAALTVALLCQEAHHVAIYSVTEATSVGRFAEVVLGD
jgi:hypothetical protein